MYPAQDLLVPLVAVKLEVDGLDVRDPRGAFGGHWWLTLEFGSTTLYL